MARKKVKAASELGSLYAKWRGPIERRLGEFRLMFRNGSEEDIFQELAFCIMTPQSKARSCWATAEALRGTGLLFDGDCTCLSREMNRVRFRNHKASYIVEARELFALGKRLHIKERLRGFKDPKKARDWLVDHVKGMGLKEASHFLRNLGFGVDLAILDRHILKNLKAYGAIPEVPRALTRRKYLELEDRMRTFSRKVGIPLAHLDLLLWCKETGEVFK